MIFMPDFRLKNAAISKRDKSKFELNEGEELQFDRGKGFFTWKYDVENHWLLIPKMVGDGHLRPQDVEKILEGKKRADAGVTAPACGLYLNKVEY